MEGNQPEREEDRSRWRGRSWKPVCPMPCSLALYAAHPDPREPAGREASGKRRRGAGRG